MLFQPCRVKTYTFTCADHDESTGSINSSGTQTLKECISYYTGKTIASTSEKWPFFYIRHFTSVE